MNNLIIIICFFFIFHRQDKKEAIAKYEANVVFPQYLKQRMTNGLGEMRPATFKVQKYLSELLTTTRNEEWIGKLTTI